MVAKPARPQSAGAPMGPPCRPSACPRLSAFVPAFLPALVSACPPASLVNEEHFDAGVDVRSRQSTFLLTCVLVCFPVACLQTSQGTLLVDVLGYLIGRWRLSLAYQRTSDTYDPLQLACQVQETPMRPHKNIAANASKETENPTEAGSCTQGAKQVF